MAGHGCSEGCCGHRNVLCRRLQFQCKGLCSQSTWGGDRRQGPSPPGGSTGDGFGTAPTRTASSDGGAGASAPPPPGIPGWPGVRLGLTASFPEGGVGSTPSDCTLPRATHAGGVLGLTASFPDEVLSHSSCTPVYCRLLHVHPYKHALRIGSEEGGIKRFWYQVCVPQSRCGEPAQVFHCMSWFLLCASDRFPSQIRTLHAVP